MRSARVSIGGGASRVRGGVTLLELAVALALVGILVATAAWRVREAAERAAVESARAELAAAFAEARALAHWRGGAALLLDTASALAVVRSGMDTAARWPLGERWGVTLRATRDSVAYDDRGLGRGAANLRAILTKGARAETVVVSRLGRVR